MYTTWDPPPTQAAKDKQLADAMQRVRGLELEVAELEKECELHQQQEHALKEALRDVERERKREEVGWWWCFVSVVPHSIHLPSTNRRRRVVWTWHT